jgi:hypothetical protein
VRRAYDWRRFRTCKEKYCAIIEGAVVVLASSNASEMMAMKTLTRIKKVSTQ